MSQWAAFSRFFGFTPAEIRGFTLSEFNAYAEYMQEHTGTLGEAHLGW